MSIRDQCIKVLCSSQIQTQSSLLSLVLAVYCVLVFMSGLFNAFMSAGAVGHYRFMSHEGGH